MAFGAYEERTVEFTQKNIQELRKIMEDNQKSKLPFNPVLSSDGLRNRLTQEIWYTNEKNGAELRLIIISSRVLVISRVNFEKKRQGCMTSVFFYLLDFCRRYHIQKIIANSIMTKEMESWAKKMHFRPVESTCYYVNGVNAGDYELCLFEDEEDYIMYDKNAYKMEWLRSQYLGMKGEFFEALANARYDKDLSFNRASDIHERDHCMRVLFFSLILAHAYGLSEDHRRPLIDAAMYHDIGRLNDWEDRQHGTISAMKYQQCTPHADLQALFLMKYHSLPDWEGETRTMKEDEPELWQMLLHIMKDSDALDRFRLGSRNLDLFQLRLPESKKMGLIAAWLWEHTKDGMDWNKIDHLILDI